MKSKLALVLSVLLGAALLTACGGSASSASSAASSAASSQPEPASSQSQPESTPALESMVYRGKVAAMTDTTFTVEQLPGFNYGFETVVFNKSDAMVMEPSDALIVEGGFVEVVYDGVMTRSLPPQATASTVYVLSTSAELTAGIIVNGTIESVEELDKDIRITVVEFKVDGSTISEMENKIILVVQEDKLEGITKDELVPGAKVSAVTNGIAALSEPPQMPVRALLPYNWDVAEAAAE